MNKLLTTTLLVCLLTMSFCAGRKHTSASRSYKITGTVTGVEDGTWIYLVNSDKFNPTPLRDSTQVKKQRFKFSGQLQDKVLQTFLGLKEPYYATGGTLKGFSLTDAAMVWLENREVTFEGEKGNLFKAKVTGSVTQQDYERYAFFQGEGDDKNESFIRQNPNSSYFSIFLLNSKKEALGAELTADLFNQLLEDKKQTVYGRQVAAYLEERRGEALDKNR